MRIAVVNNFFPPRPGGSAHLADNLAKAYAVKGHEVLVLTATYQDAPLEEVRDGVRIVRVPAWVLPKNRFAANFDIAFTISPRAKRVVYGILDAFAPDVIHQHGQFFDLTWLSGMWARKHRVPTLLSIHTRLYSPNGLNNFIYRMGDALLVKPLMRTHKPRLVVMDVLMDQYINQRYGRAFSGKVFIPVGIDPDIHSGGDPAVGRDLLNNPEGPTILSIGHVIPQRNRLALVEAMPRVLAEFPDAKVYVIGGVYYDAFVKRAHELGISQSVIALGARPRHEIPDLLAAADVETHELDGQGFGTASLEALAAGVPVVAAIRPDNFVEVLVEDGRELILTPFVNRNDERAEPSALADTLIKVLRDPAAVRSQVAVNARELIENHFTIEKITEKHLDTLKEMLDGRR